jgi:hypothetical protein
VLEDFYKAEAKRERANNRWWRKKR